MTCAAARATAPNCSVAPFGLMLEAEWMAPVVGPGAWAPAQNRSLYQRAPTVDRKSLAAMLDAITPEDARSMNMRSFELVASSSVIGRSMMPPSIARLPPNGLKPV